MDITAIMPIKLNNERLPNKNIKLLGNKPLLQYQLENLLNLKVFKNVDVYCSDEAVCRFLPQGVRFIERPKELDLPSSNFTQIFESYRNIVSSDIYVYAHATAPFVFNKTIQECLNAVLSKKYDSAFCAVKIQDFLWQNGKPLNFSPDNIPRTQDLDVIYRETSGIYVFTKEAFLKSRQRIGDNPFTKEVSFVEAVDINNPDDFYLAELVLPAFLSLNTCDEFCFKK